MYRTLILVGALVSVASVGSVRAQSKQGTPSAFTAGLGITYGTLAGGELGGTKAGAGFDVNAGGVIGRWQLAVGYDRTNHGHEDTDGDFVVSNIYFEPRLMLASASRAWTPYAAIRIGRAMATYEGVLGITDKASGYIAGIGAGVLWPIAGLVQADAGAHYARLSHDYGTGDYSDAERGGRMSVRVGLRIAKPR